MIMVKNSRITDWVMSRMLTLAVAISLEMPAIVPTGSEPMMVTIARPDRDPPPSLSGSLATFVLRSIGPLRTIGDRAVHCKKAAIVARAARRRQWRQALTGRSGAIV